MTRAGYAIAGAWVLLAAWTAAQTIQGGQAPPMFRAKADSVTVDVSVRNGSKVVTGLTAADFEVLDNGERQQVVDVSYGKLPIDVTVTLDISYSVTGSELDRLRRAIGELMADLGPDDRLKLLMFNTRVTRVVDFTSDVAALERAIGGASAAGATSIFDAISVGLISADHPDRRQLVVLFTDGQDSLSTTEPKVLIEVAQRTNATLTAVVPASLFGFSRGSLFAGAVTRPEGRVYKQLADDTGGVVIQQASRTEDLTATFRRALDEFRSSYVLYFSPHDVKRGLHTLEVTVPQNRKFTVRARRGYWVE